MYPMPQVVVNLLQKSIPFYRRLEIDLCEGLVAVYCIGNAQVEPVDFNFSGF